MVHLLSVHDEFHARVIAARLGSDGILTELRPPLGGPYPLLGEVQVYVGEGDLLLARDLLLADARDRGAPVEGSLDAESGPAPDRRLVAPATRMAVAALLLVALLLLALNRAG